MLSCLCGATWQTSWPSSLLHRDDLTYLGRLVAADQQQTLHHLSLPANPNGGVRPPTSLRLARQYASRKTDIFTGLFLSELRLRLPAGQDFQLQARLIGAAHHQQVQTVPSLTFSAPFSSTNPDFRLQLRPHDTNNPFSAIIQSFDCLISYGGMRPVYAMGSRTAVTIDPGIAHISGQISALLTDTSLHSWPARQQTAALNLMLSSGAGSDLMMLDMPAAHILASQHQTGQPDDPLLVRLRFELHLGGSAGTRPALSFIHIPQAARKTAA